MIGIHPYAYLTATYDCCQPSESTYDEAIASLATADAFLALLAPIPSSACVPIPSTKGKEETLYRALRSRGVDRLQQSTTVEVDKQQRLGALGTQGYTRAQLPSNALEVEGHCLYKVKADGRDTCRIAGV